MKTLLATVFIAVCFSFGAVTCSAADITPTISPSQVNGRDGILKMETGDVFSGKYSLRFKGQTYLAKVSEDAYNTRSGDIYVVRYMAKSTGNTIMYFTVYGGGGAHMLERKGTPVADR